MITKKFFPDESGVTVAFETILLFSISVIFLGMIFISFQDMSQRQSKILMEEELLTIGNSIAKQMSDLTVEARASNRMGSRTTISSEFWIPVTIADSAYKITLTSGKIYLESTSSPYISVEVPVNTDIKLAEKSTIYSNDGRQTLEYDSRSSAIYFKDGGVIPYPDFNAPTISIDTPLEGATINRYTYINTTPWDETSLARVDFYLNGVYRYTAGPPWNWLWDTRGEMDGNYKIIAVAYDAAGNAKPASRNYTILNPLNYLPEITVISPVNESYTDFKRPVIKATITDDKAIDFSSIRLLVNGINQTANITLNTVNSKLTTLTYMPSQDMAVGWHNANITVKDLNTTPMSALPANWSFEVIPMNDSFSPTATIVYPTAATLLVPGTPITVTYLASDLGDSGIDNLTINVRRSDGFLYKYQQNVSIYPNVVYRINPQETWTFSSNYMGAMNYNYTYNLTVFDRSGKSVITTLGPLNVALHGQDSQFDVDTSNNATPGKSLKNIKIWDNVSSDSIVPKIKKITVTWVSNLTTDRIESIKIDNTGYWSGSSASGSQLNLTVPYTTLNTPKDLDLYFNVDVDNRTFTIEFLLDDSTKRTVTFKAKA